MSKDLLSGLFFVVLGVAVTAVSLQYAIGTPQQMGPGFFPAVLGALVTLIGIAVSARALLAGAPGEAAPRWEVRPLVFVLAAIVAFGFLIERAGLVVSVAALVVIARLGGRDIRPLELAVLIVILVALAIGIFVFGLKLPLHLGFS